MDNTDQALGSLIEKLTDAGLTYAPEIVEGAVRALYFNGLVQIVFGIISICLFLIFFIIAHKGFKDDIDGLQVLGCFGCGVCSIAGILCFIIKNPWLKVLDPEAALYYWILVRAANVGG